MKTVIPAEQGGKAALSPQVATAGELTQHRKALPALTGVRFFAAFYVVLVHSHYPTLLNADGWTHTANFVSHGGLAVVLFFLLSGFILSYTYQGQIEAKGSQRRFYEARFARIWPLYFVSLLLSSALNHTTPSPGVGTAVLLMVQAWNPWNSYIAGAWNFVCWTLSTEALFYLLFPFAQRWLERRPTRTQMVVLGGLLLACASLRTGQHSYGFPAGGFWMYIPLAVIHVPEFLVGVCLGTLYNRHLPSEKGSRWIPRMQGFWTMASAAATLLALSFSDEVAATLCVIMFAALLYGLAAEHSPLQRFLSTKILLIGGQISYGIYLLQWPIKFLSKRLCDMLHLGSLEVRFMVYVFLLMGVSYAGFHLVEEPARKLLRNCFARIERVRDAGAVRGA